MIPESEVLATNSMPQFINIIRIEDPMSRKQPLQFKFYNSKGDITYQSTTVYYEDDEADSKQKVELVLKSGAPLIEAFHDETHSEHGRSTQLDAPSDQIYDGEHKTVNQAPQNQEQGHHAFTNAFIPVISESGETIGVLNAKMNVSHVQKLMENAFYDISDLTMIGAAGILLIPILALALRTWQVMRSDRKLLELAKYDQTTGIYNRATALRVLAKAFPPPNAREGYGILFIDVDYFKRVNDTFGHHSGDLVLKHIATVLQTCIRQERDIVARYGGDEFLIICPDINMQGLRRVYQRIEQKIKEPFEIAGKPHKIGLSIGAYVSTKSDSKISALHKADLAVYAAKRAGRGQSAEYSSDLETDAVDPEQNQEQEAVSAAEMPLKSA
ncbi:GGDEF domain-containing protein [Roseibium algae]|uniref:GGDEF domain-containing protein n=1 Tax=Roseibium algae TaxID=3123038 RepID=A0ABU8TK58_9HYPH